MGDVLKFYVPGKPEYVSTVRMVVSSLANAAGFDVESIEDIKVAVSEACTNVVCHGMPEGNSYEVFCEIGDGLLRISVTDQAGGCDMDQYRCPDLDCPKEGGLGLFIIRTLMDEVNIFSELGRGTRIQMIKYRQK